MNRLSLESGEHERTEPFDELSSTIEIRLLNYGCG